MRWRPLSLLLCLFAAACGFEPVYQQQHPQALEPHSRALIEQMRIVTPAGRDGDLFKAALEDRLHQYQPPDQPHYLLETNIDLTTRPFIIDPDGVSLRYEMQMQVRYALLRTRDNARLLQGKLERQVHYNVSEQDDYSTFIAERDARQKGLDILAAELALRLASQSGGLPQAQGAAP